MGKLKIGLIGTGSIATVHAHNVQASPDAEVVIVASDTPIRARAFADRFDIPDSCSPHNAVFGYDLDAVLICSASATHASLVKQAAEQGIATFCEKPLGLSVAEIDDALHAVEAKRVSLTVGFNRRFDQKFRSVRRGIERDVIGEPRLLLITSSDPEFPSESELQVPGRLFHGTMIHDLDIARFLIGSEIESIRMIASASKRAKIYGQVDTAVASLRFQNGALGMITTSWRHGGLYDQRAEVHGARGSLTVVNDTFMTGNAKVPFDASFYVRRYAASYREEMRTFIQHVREGKPLQVSGHDARMATTLAEAALESHETGETVFL